MCDYSLHGVANRPAKVGDTLVLTAFPNSFTRGFTAVGDPKTAVCLCEGTELEIDDPISLRHTGVLGTIANGILWLTGTVYRIPPKKLPGGTAQFTQVDMKYPDRHHDALRLPNGQVFTLQQLATDLKAKVLQLPATAKKLPEETQKAVQPTPVHRADPLIPVADEVAAVE